MTNQEKKQASNVESAIRSLYSKFKDLSGSRFSCVQVNTKEIEAIRRKIAKRKKELDADKQLKALEKELKDESCRVILAAKAQHERVDGLLRKLQVRGVSPDLLDEVEALSNEKPAYVEVCECGSDDE